MHGKGTDAMRRGFTLVELLVVMGMIAILTGAAASSVSRARRRSQIARAESECRQITNAILAYENWSEDHTLKKPSDTFKNWQLNDKSKLGFILGTEPNANGPNGLVPVLYNGAVVNNAIRDPWGKPYKIKVKDVGTVKVSVNSVNNLKTFMAMPNRNRIAGGEK